MPEFDPTQIDTLLETLTGVVRARVRPDENGRQLREIHVLSDGALAPKQIVRNIETLLKTAFDLTIDHRIVSIAVLKEGADVEDTGREPPPGERSRRATAGSSATSAHAGPYGTVDGHARTAADDSAGATTSRVRYGLRPSAHISRDQLTYAKTSVEKIAGAPTTRDTMAAMAAGFAH